jgi:hypothetical protein
MWSVVSLLAREGHRCFRYGRIHARERNRHKSDALDALRWMRCAGCDALGAEREHRRDERGLRV